MVLKFQVSHPIKRRCSICNESKLIPLNIRPICKECLIKRKNKIIYYEKLILVILLIIISILLVISLW